MIKEFRSLYQNIFGNKPQTLAGVSDFKLLNDFTPSFYNFSGELYDSATVRSCIHAIASNAAKLKPTHSSKDIKLSGVASYETLLGLRPNEFISSYDFVYRIVSQLYVTNNAFVYIRRDNRGNITGLYPINHNSLKLVELQGVVFAQFDFRTGCRVTLPYEELIHIRRHYNRNDMFGESSFEPLHATLQTMVTADQGIINAIKSSVALRGLLQFNGTYNDATLKKQKDAFLADYLNINNSSGIAALDHKASFTPLEMKPVMADDKQMALARDNVYRYFNISEKIVKSEYNENEFNAFYSSVLEPIAIQMSLEFTYKIFTRKEIEAGNKILFSAERMTFANNKTKADIIKILMPLGVISPNEAREIFELTRLEEESADKRIISLNYVDATKANEYQLGVNSDDAGNDDKKTDSDGGA